MENNITLYVVTYNESNKYLVNARTPEEALQQVNTLMCGIIEPNIVPTVSEVDFDYGRPVLMNLL